MPTIFARVRLARYLFLPGLAALLGVTGCGGPPRAQFSITVSPANAPALRDATRRVKVELTRQGSFAAEVAVTLQNPPLGVTGDLLSLAEGSTEGTLFIAIGPEVALQDLPLTVVASSGAASTTAPLVLSIREEQPSAREKIAAGLKAGQLSLGSSLLYRCMARVGDDRLPADFRGSGGEEDLGLFWDIDVARPLLTPAELAALQPYMVRPAQSDSIYATLPAAQRTPGQRSQALMGWQTPAPFDCVAGNTWRSQRSTTVPVRVWIECGDAISSPIEVTSMNRMLALFEKIWGPMTGLMGVPLQDSGGPDEGGDDAIDVYLVMGAINRGEADQDIYSVFDLGANAYAAPSPPYVKNTSGRDITSSYIVVPRVGALSEEVRGTLIHEFFHVLQSAHNREVAFQSNGDEYWFVEASATWAKVHYDRVLAWPARISGAEHKGRFGRYQRGEAATNASQPVKHMYASYIWPFFLEQLTGSAQVMGAIWRGLEPAANFEAADAVLDQQQSFAENFHEFALRNLNAPFLPGDPLPHDKRYHKLDDTFPDGRFSPTKEYPPITVGSTFNKALDMPALSAAYFRLTREGEGVRKVEIDLSGLQPQGSLDVDALVETADGWLDEPLRLTGSPKVVFCFDKGTSTKAIRGSFNTLELVLSNHAWKKAERVSGELRITSTDKPCGIWVGSTRATSSYSDGAGTTMTQSITANAALEYDPDNSLGGEEIYYRLRSGDFTSQTNTQQSGRNPPCRTMVTAAGPMHPGSPSDPSPGSSTAYVALYTGSQPPSYQGSGSSWATLTEVSNCNDQNTDVTKTSIGWLTWWGTQGVEPFYVSPDGKTLSGKAGSANTLGVPLFEWTFTKQDE